MRLDHVSYVASHDQISDVVNRIGSQIGTAFVDGGIHPKFGTRNFTAPLLNGQYIEIVCPLDHPATDATPFGQAVKKKADSGGGWMAWVIAVDNIDKVEKHYGRKATEGKRQKPDGTILEWKQLGVKDILQNSQLPFYVEWISNTHPSTDGVSFAKLTELIIFGESDKSLSNLVEVSKLEPKGLKLSFIAEMSDFTGIKEIVFEVNGQNIVID
jgi:hypothetical protein